MDIIDMYNERNEITTIYLPAVKDSFISDKNKILLSHIISSQIYVTNNNNRFKLLTIDINKEIDLWVKNGNLDKLENTASFISNDISLQLDYYNSLFIKKYLNKITKLDQHQFELDNNCYKQVTNINGKDKTFKDFLPQDYENINVSNYNNAYTSNGNFSQNYNRIPSYRKIVFNRNIDRSFNANDMLKNESRTNNSYKRYNNEDLLKNVLYLRKNNKY